VPSNVGAGYDGGHPPVPKPPWETAPPQGPPGSAPVLDESAPRLGGALGSDAQGPSTGAHGRNRNRRRHLLEWVAVVAFAVVVAGGLRAFVVQAFYVPSGSMLPTLQIGDRIVVVKIGYAIHRGDVVVFRRPPADTTTTDADLVKRVIGLPGETISSRGVTVLIDGKPLKEPWLRALTGVCAETAENIPTTRILPGHYFVMGDCRGYSADSRSWGTLAASYIVGKVVVIVWRFGHPYLHWF